MDYNNVNRWYNIGIKPYMDYMETFQSYPTITDYQDTSTHERVKTSSMNEMNECNEFMNVILERKDPI